MLSTRLSLRGESVSPENSFDSLPTEPGILCRVTRRTLMHVVAYEQVEEALHPVLDVGGERCSRRRCACGGSGRRPSGARRPCPPPGRCSRGSRGKGVTGAMIRARIRVDGRLAGGLQALLGAPMSACSGCGERDGRIGHGKRRSRTGTAHGHPLGGRGFLPWSKAKKKPKTPKPVFPKVGKGRNSARRRPPPGFRPPRLPGRRR